MPETLVPACEELEAAFREAWADPAFRAELDDLLRDYAGRPVAAHRVPPPVGERARAVGSCSSGRTSTTPARTRSTTCSARPCWPGAWARPGWSPRPAPASTAWPPPPPPRCSGMECVVYMGEVDIERQALNVFRMRLLGAEVRPGAVGQPHAEGRHQRGHARLGGHRRDHPLLPRLGHGPAPVPVDGARVPPGASATRPGRSAGRCSAAPTPTSSWPASAAARTPSGIFSGFVDTPTPSWSGVEPAGGAAIGHGVPGVVHGMSRYLLQDEDGQVLEAHSISAGLDYPGVGPEHAHLADIGRARYEAVTDDEVARRLPAAVAAPRASSRPSSRPTPSPGWSGTAPALAGPHRAASTCRAGATRTSPR